jgi:hypothetical protein
VEEISTPVDLDAVLQNIEDVRREEERRRERAAAGEEEG